ncbi:hypothetical protein BS47DRAFT_1394848 [Hydnum rufescens UP504]|uniref:Uncharacterized protein n=1 Tax=Hydnum rufescens UP504 TaxID=1448309 RepID=A0A9P6ATM7_9AGAM|nr:hypothetical protein BS47DRAFT_1394848 [Hydnum rufescens UP504]
MTPVPTSSVARVLPENFHPRSGHVTAQRFIDFAAVAATIHPGSLSQPYVDGVITADFVPARHSRRAFGKVNPKTAVLYVSVAATPLDSACARLPDGFRRLDLCLESARADGWTRNHSVGDRFGSTRLRGDFRATRLTARADFEPESRQH